MLAVTKVRVSQRLKKAALAVANSNSGEYTRIRNKALVQLSAIEARTGKTPRHLLAAADAYATDVFGDKKFAPWLYVNTAMAGEFRPGWIPNDYYKVVVLPRINGTYGPLAMLKSLNARIFPLAASLDVGTFVNGQIFALDGERLTIDAAAKVMFRDTERIIYKPDHSNQGQGIRTFDRGDFRLENTAGLANGVFQRFVRQHPVLSSLSPSAVTTVRLTTALDPSGVPTLRACHLRLGGESDSWVISVKEIFVPVDRTSGRLSDVGFLADWTPISAHPDTGVRFSGLAVPAFAEAVALVLDLHSKFTFVQVIGWDLAIDETGTPRVMEWNGNHPGITFSEAVQGPCFAGLGWEELWRDNRGKAAAAP